MYSCHVWLLSNTQGSFVRFIVKSLMYSCHVSLLSNTQGSFVRFIIKTGLDKIVAHLTNHSLFKKRFFQPTNQIPRVKFWLWRNKRQRDWIGALKRLNCLSQRSLADQHYLLWRSLPLTSEKTSGIQGRAVAKKIVYSFDGHFGIRIFCHALNVGLPSFAFREWRTQGM